MDHLAIMKKGVGSIEDVLSGDKGIESRWGMMRSVPWNRVKQDDTVYFKYSGCKVTAKADVEKVEQYENYSESELKTIISKYGGKGYICFSHPETAFEDHKRKRYCTLIFLKNPEKIEPFNINKKGFGTGSAWLCVDDINSIRI